MANSYVAYTGNGATTNRSVPFAYIDRSYVFVTVDEVVTAFTWVSSATISISPAPAADTDILIYRVTPRLTVAAVLANGAVDTADAYNLIATQMLHSLQEIEDGLGAADANLTAVLAAASAAAADALETAADVLLTNADVVSTGADVLLTNADVVLTHADVVLTHADVVLTGADVDETNADVVLTHADVVLTGADVDETNADVVLTHADVVLTAADVIAAEADRVAAAASAAAAAATLASAVVGPASATDDLPMIFDGTTGKLAKSKTYAAFKTLLALVKGDVGLGNVDNISDANKPVSTAQATADALKIAGPGTVTNDNPVVFSGTTGLVVAQKTYAAFKTLLVLVKGDVGLGSVDNTSDAGKPVSTAQQTALDLKAPKASPTFTGTVVLPSAQALTDPVITGTILEDVYTITDGAAFEIDPGNGSVQLITLTASRTPAATNFAAGESVTLMIADGTAYTITWTSVAVTWVGGSAPTLATTGYTVVELWKVGSVIYGARVGDVA